MSSANPHRPSNPHSKLNRLTALALVGVAGIFSSAQASAATAGETFVFDWTETSGADVGLTGMVDLTLGAASSKAGFFDVSMFDVTAAGGFCGVCTPKTVDLTGLLFDATTNGLVGDVTGSYLNTKGNTHTFNLSITDLPAGTWTYADAGPAGTSTDMGTYTTTQKTSVPEPTTLGLLGLGMFTMGIFRRRRGL